MGFFRTKRERKNEQNLVIIISSLYIANRVKDRLEETFPKRAFSIDWFGREALLFCREGNPPRLKRIARRFFEDEYERVRHG